MVVVVVVGMPGSGKDALLRAAKSLGFAHASMGDAVRRRAAELGLGSSDAEIGGLANSERERHGPAVWAERTFETMPRGNAIIDGSRSLAEIEWFRERLGSDLRVIAVTAPREERFRRLRARGRQDAPGTMDEFVRREERERAWGLEEAIGSADIFLDNAGTLEEFEARCLTMLRELLAGDGKSI